jgi:hypothetical protein
MSVTLQTEVLESAQRELAAVCTELSRLTTLPAPPLEFSDPEIASQPLFVYGIVGGKDVGKTTLINAIAGSTISFEHHEVGPGTHTPVIYVHHDDAPLLRQRLSADAGLEFEVSTHDREVLRHVALVDLPDFDSKRNLPDHARRAAAFKPYLDAFVWVTTVRKIDHPELLRQMQSVSPKKENFLCVVTFADEVVESAKDSLEGLKRLCVEKVHRLYFEDYSPDNLFAICTLKKGIYDFPALERRLVRKHTIEEIAERRSRNALRSSLASISQVREHYRLDESLGALTDILRELPERCRENMPESYWETVSDRVSRLDGPYRRLAARLFSHRIWNWPILSALLFPLSAVVSYLGGRLFFEAGNRWTDYHQLKDMLTVDALTLDVRLRRVAAELRAKFLRLHQLFKELLTFEFDGEAEFDRWHGWLDDNDRRTLDGLQQRYTRPGFWRRCIVYLPILWFPILQPVLEKYLAQKELTNSGLAKGFAWTFVSLLSASYLLQSAAVLLVVYSMWLLWFYSSSARQVARQRLSGFGTLRQSTLEPSLQSQLAAPYEHLADLLTELRDRLERQADVIRERLEGANA